MKVLVGCEESQRVCTAFRALGHEAYSCDLQKCSGGHPEWHILGDVSYAIESGTKHMQDGSTVYIGHWDLLIAHPPCTYLSVIANRSHSIKRTPVDKINARTYERIDAMRFFMDLITADVERIAIENPVGVMNTAYRKPDQIIHPYQFAKDENDEENYVTKATCLWLKNLSLLVGNELERPDNKKIFGICERKGCGYSWTEMHHGSKIRSKTFSGIAKAMAEQWGA